MAAALLLLAGSGGGQAEPAHGIAMHGEPALPPDFPHLPYADPDAPKGGRLGFANVGTFDSLNPFIVRGTAPRGLWDVTWGNNVWESLLTRNKDEAFSLYGLLAETVESPADRSWVEFRLNPEARFSDGAPVTVEDVRFSFELLAKKGRPNFRSWADAVTKIESVGEHGIRFTLAEGSSRELPLLLGMFPIFPKHATDPDTFDRSGFTIPVGSGPYMIAEVNPGTRVTLRRNPDYWGKDLPVKRGTDNFDEIRVEYFRDSNSYFEAFKKGLFDMVVESDPNRWAIGYDFPAARDGRVKLDEFETGVPKAMIGFVFNTRRPPFDAPKVREALTYFLDFEWINRNLYHDLYQRTGSFFQGSELSALGQPADARERALLAAFPDAVRPEVMEGRYAPPVSDGTGRDRANLKRGMNLLTEAGYGIRGGKLVEEKTGQPLRFEMLVLSRDQERLALAFQRTLGLIGIELGVRQVDAAQYWERLKSFDFDMIQWTYAASLSPGNEQRFRWSSQSADSDGSFNFAGVRNPAVDATIDALLAAVTREEFLAAARALDRVLISGFYVLPLFHPPGDWVARWTRVVPPERGSLYGPEPTTWWSAEAAR
ncbi:extracellular solute-binding protein [Faunimonas sp. B44]|uniref:extracellular solute-binding protein n=1 Tax=Faunimonas sp. B44 TaxID=3461493 RepID=UPI0040439896